MPSTIQGEISRIAQNVADSLTAVANKGVTVPSGSNSDDLAGLIAQISGGGGGGLEYETGTYTPASDIGRASVTFANSHTALPMFAAIVDTGGTNNTDNSMIKWAVVNWHALVSSIVSIYGQALYDYYRAASAAETANSTNIQQLTGSGNTRLSSYLTTTGFTSYNTNSYSYRSGRTYKWVAVWAPTT